MRRLERGEIAKFPEPKPYYDELRLLAMPFFLALGLRIGEVCRLHKDSIGYDEQSEKWFLRVLTEKGELTNARPVPRRWQNVIIQSHERILEITKPFRAFAKDVESRSEQAFLDVLTFSARHDILAKAMADSGYCPDEHFVRSEIGKTDNLHPSGLTYNSLRVTKDKNGDEKKGIYADAILGDKPNSPGTIDSDYRGPLGVILMNAGQEAFAVTHGMRIAQMVVAPVVRAVFEPVEALDNTARGAGGFGSTGVE